MTHVTWVDLRHMIWLICVVFGINYTPHGTRWQCTAKTFNCRFRCFWVKTNMSFVFLERKNRFVVYKMSFLLIFGEISSEFDSVNGVTGSNSVVNLLWFEKKIFFLQQNHNRFWLCEFIHRLKFCCISVAFVEDSHEVLYWTFEFWIAFLNVIIYRAPFYKVWDGNCISGQSNHLYL